MSTLTVTTINTGSNTTPLTLTTGNNTVGIDILAMNSTIRLIGTTFLKNGQILGAGKQTMWLPAAAFVSRVTSGPALNQVQSTTNLINYKTYDFDPASIETTELQIRMPKSWDKGNITFVPVCSQLSTTAGAVSWNLSAGVVSAGDSIDQSYSTPVTVTVSVGTANILYTGTESSVITPAGSPADGDLLNLALARFATGSGDTLAIDARLHGINMYYTANADSDL